MGLRTLEHRIAGDALVRGVAWVQSALNPPSLELRALGAWFDFSVEEAKQARYRVRALQTQAIAASDLAGCKSAHARGKLG